MNDNLKGVLSSCNNDYGTNPYKRMSELNGEGKARYDDQPVKDDITFRLPMIYLS